MQRDHRRLGGWGCLIPYGWSGTVTPSKPGNLFTPASRSYTNVTDHINSNNFATAASHAVSGTITFEGSPLSGAAVAGSNGASCTSTNASGEYTCAVLPGWSGTVTPSIADTVFTPASRSYTNVTAAQSAQSYIAQATFYQVSGSVTLNGLRASERRPRRDRRRDLHELERRGPVQLHRAAKLVGQRHPFGERLLLRPGVMPPSTRNSVPVT